MKYGTAVFNNAVQYTAVFNNAMQLIAHPALNAQLVYNALLAHSVYTKARGIEFDPYFAKRDFP